MKKQPEIANRPTGTLTVLSVSPIKEDHRALQSIIGHSNWGLFEADCVPRALSCLRQREISVIVCERELGPETWIDILQNSRELTNPPSLIVTSRLADEDLWGEALNLGAWDVLAKPFDRTEVLRTVALAGVHWHNQMQLPVLSVKVMKAAS